MDDEPYANVREDGLLGRCLGQRVVEVTQHDQDEWDETGIAYVTLHFENGFQVTFWIGEDGFHVESLGDDEEDGDGPRDGCAPASE